MADNGIGSIVVIGGGLAGAKAVEALRAKGFEGSLTLVADESELPYDRPPLSKDYLHGKSAFEDQVVHPQQWYADHDVDLRLGTAAMSLDLDARRIGLADGDELTYDRLLLATGGTPRKLDVDGGDSALYLRSHHDSDVLRQRFADGAKVVVIGGGWIGLEVAAAARDAGCAVTLVEEAEQPLLVPLGAELGEFYADLHREKGVEVRLGARLRAITTDDDGNVTGVKLADGPVEGDLVVAGVGVAPDDSLARLAGLHVDNGITVDSSLRTSDRHVWAVGDVANHAHPLLGTNIRVEHWANALNQPAVAAAAMLGDSEARYDRLPYFYSDQYDVGMEYVGYATAKTTDRIVYRGDKDAREFVAFWLDSDSHVLAAMNVNVWDVVDAIKPVIAERRVVDPDKLADASVDYADL